VERRGSYDTLVVGAGSAGCALAGRLPGRVLLLEAGPADVPPDLRDAASLAATAPTHPRNWAYAAELRPGRPAVVPRGRGLGGSGAINGANWLWATPADARDWAQPGWSWPDLVAAYRRAETDLDPSTPHSTSPAPSSAPSAAPAGWQESHIQDVSGPESGFPDTGEGRAARAGSTERWGHGDAGPVPVRRAAGDLLHPATERFLRAAAALGFPAEPDKNAGGPPGVGLIPCNAVDGVRVDPATAYLRAARGVTVRGDAPVARILFDGDRARGVELVDGTVIEAGEVVLAAGAVATPQVLMLSGIGPADELRAVGVPVRVDLPVGRGWSTTPRCTCRSPPATRPRTRTRRAARSRWTWTAVATRPATARCCCSPARSPGTGRCTSCAPSRCPTAAAPSPWPRPTPGSAR
jgi:choline dehydrogenase-like flavoprotein